MKGYRKKGFKGKRRNYGYGRRVRKKNSLWKSRVFWDFVLGIVFVCSLCDLLFFSQAFKIQEIKITAPSDISYSALHKLIEEGLQKNSFWFLPSNSLFLANCSRMEARILQEFPEIQEASLKKDFPKTIVLEVKKREAVGNLCYWEKNIEEYLVEEETKTIEDVLYKCFLITEQGIIFKEVEKENIGGDLTILIAKIGDLKKLGEEVISQERMSQMLEIKKVLEDRLNLKLQSFYIAKESSLIVKIGEGWEIYIDLEGDIVLALTKLELLLEKEISQEKRKNLQYIDLRFSKVYYK